MRFREDEIQKMAFHTHYGHSNAPATFVDLMNRVYILMLNLSVIIFIDDILVYSMTKEQHEEQLHDILVVLQIGALYAKFSKCKFWLRRV